MTEAKVATAIPREQQCSDELDAIERLENEKKTHGIQAGKLKEQMQKLEMQVKESYEVLVRMKKEAKESSEVAAKIKKELQEMERKNKELDNELQKITAEEQILQVDLKKKTQELGSCMSNNAELCLLAEELVEKYRSKGLGTMILEKEPLTQIKKVKLERLSQKYLEQIKQKKMDNKLSGGKE
jgi:chromosome segregation ATPase